MNTEYTQPNEKTFLRWQEFFCAKCYYSITLQIVIDFIVQNMKDIKDIEKNQLQCNSLVKNMT